MSDPSTNVPIEQQDLEIKPEIKDSIQNGHIGNVADRKQKQKPVEGTPSARYPMRTVPVKAKSKKKDEGPLEIVCGWIVEHQIGMYFGF